MKKIGILTVVFVLTICTLAGCRSNATPSTSPSNTTLPPTTLMPPTRETTLPTTVPATTGMPATLPTTDATLPTTDATGTEGTGETGATDGETRSARRGTGRY